ncbi:hypothetical protein HPB48_012337 [Haemaphysalis longicornis]|uniref:Uncharacterized protein n=1 Tax=Haemaphysalis longicornis TaxID=44386 RepID=A0A9J6G1Q9_HAELO|nr:hypothetical protein HPB48_012337 [Haemaphysalis longicornis]
MHRVCVKSIRFKSAKGWWFSRSPSQATNLADLDAPVNGRLTKNPSSLPSGAAGLRRGCLGFGRTAANAADARAGRGPDPTAGRVGGAPRTLGSLRTPSSTPDRTAEGCVRT